MTPDDIRHKWRGLRRLAPERRRTVIAAAVLLPLTGALLRLLGFSRSYAMLSSLTAPRSVPATLDAVQRVRDVAELIRMAATHGPYRAPCLPRSLLLWLILRRQGIETALRVGVRKADGRLHAHAWIEYQGCIVNDDDAHEQFAVFDRATLA